MSKPLSEMTLEELWQLFPIILKTHNEQWNEWYYDEEKRIKAFLPGDIEYRLEHIGSTAIKGIYAKPIIDIMLEVNDEAFGVLTPAISSNGYICMSRNDTRISFNRGYTEQGFAERVFHLHMRHIGDNDELYFRDYMNENPITAKKYEQLKLSLLKEYEHDRDGYTNAKTDFIKHFTAIAKEQYPARYL